MDIESYIKNLIKEEEDFKNRSLQPDKLKVDEHKSVKRIFRLVHFILCSFIDYYELLFRIRFKKNFLKQKRIVYTARNFCNLVDGKYEDRIVRPLFTEDIVFINQSKEYVMDSVNGQRVYNIGGVVKFIAAFYFHKSKVMRIFRAYRSVNDAVLKRLPEKQEVFMLWFYDLNGLSLVFSSHKTHIKLIEVQHGSIVNYPPYSKPAPAKVADVFYVKNMPTAEYLKTHLCLNFPSEYLLIPYPKGNRKFLPGIHILYASSIEFKGLHPVFKNFLANNKKLNLSVKIRLHPRERDKEPLFDMQMKELGVNYEFDRSKNWLESADIENLIIISPWSSTLEDAYDNDFIAITIDPVGKERFSHLIDNRRFFYSEEISSEIIKIARQGK